MRLLTKEFYTLAELQAAWDMADQDIQYLIATGRLKLSIVVYLRSRGITMPLPQSIRYREGAMRQYGALVPVTYSLLHNDFGKLPQLESGRDPSTRLLEAGS